jgi:2-oxoglutarate ferredoxin oxidoreductase subunit delta
MSEEVNATGYRFPILHDGCTGCTACQMVCPDAVFEVYRLTRAGA